MAMPSSVRVNSGPRDTIILRMKDKMSDLIAIEVGTVMTMAAETRRNAQRRPDRWGPVSVGTKWLSEHVHSSPRYRIDLLGSSS